jgi:TPR repeat protein
MSKTCEERVQEMMKRVDVNDAWAMCVIAGYYNKGAGGLQQNQERAKDLWTQAAKLGSSEAHFQLGTYYHDGGDLKKAKFHYEAAAMAGCDDARYNLGCMEGASGNVERAVKHWKIAASIGNHKAMQNLKVSYNKGLVSRESIDSTLTAYNNSCADMRSEARDSAISKLMAVLLV